LYYVNLSLINFSQPTELSMRAVKQCATVIKCDQSVILITLITMVFRITRYCIHFNAEYGYFDFSEAYQ